MLQAQEVRVLGKDVNLEFQREKMWTILGASGSGKMTFLSLTAGLIVLKSRNDSIQR